MKVTEIVENIRSIAIILAIVFVCGILFRVSGSIANWSLSNKIAVDKFTKLTENIAAKGIVTDTKALEDKIDDLDKEITDYAKEKNEQINQIGETVAGIKQVVDKKLNSNKIYSTGGKHDYEFIKIYSKDTDGKKYPVAWAMYQPNQTPEKRWKTGTYPIEFHSKIIISENEQTSHSLMQAWIENNQMKETKGNRYPITVKDIEWTKRLSTNKSWSFNPRISLSMMAGNDDIYPALSLSWFSYGRTKGDMDWRFFPMGIGGSGDETFMHVSLLEYNVAKHIPLIDNMFIGPYINFDSDFEKDYMMGLSIPF